MDLKKSTPAVIGFLTVVQDSQDHLIGGYLVLNSSGRPLEFHCTAPVRPNRAQTILYGPTLKPYLYGEQIGSTLIEKAGTKASVVLTDLRAAMTVRGHIGLPVALVCGAAEGAVMEGPVMEGAVAGSDDGLFQQSLRTMVIGEATLAIDAQHPEDLARTEAALTGLASPLDLLEPFDRIRKAIGEASQDAKQRVSNQAAKRAA